MISGIRWIPLGKGTVRCQLIRTIWWLVPLSMHQGILLMCLVHISNISLRQLEMAST
jgi:hypothetical protein